MRTQLDPLFSEYLLQIGNGIEKTCFNECIRFPPTMTIPYIENISTLNILIDDVFPNINKYTNNLDFMINKVILTPRIINLVI